MRITVRHATTYRYPSTASQAVLALRMTPQGGPGQTVQDWRIEAPGIARAAHYTDAFGNLVHVVAVPAGHDSLELVAAGTIETRDTGGVTGYTNEAARSEIFLRSTPATKPDAAISALAARAQGETALSTMHALMEAVHEAVAYVPESTHSGTSAVTAFAAGRGVCQDHAHIMLAAARSLGIPARYVTGYLLLEAGADAPAHHAWIEAGIDTLGWVGFDAANNLCPTDRYIRLTSGLDAAAAAPIRGVRRGGAEDILHVSVAVSELES